MKILDACCGSRMFWFDKQNENTTYMDIREYHEELLTGHVIDVKPDIVASRPNDKLKQRFTKDEIAQVPEIYKTYATVIEEEEETEGAE